MDIKITAAIITSLLSIICFLPYLRDIFNKKSTPHIYSWLVWSILQAEGTIAIIVGHGSYGALGIGIGTLFCSLIFFLSFKYGTKNITRFDKICLAGSILSVVLWIFTKDPTLAVILISVIDFMAFMPTYRKGYEEPLTETVSTYLLSSISSIFALVALTDYSVATSLYLVSLVLSNGIFVIILIYRRSKTTKTITSTYK
jgi:hypothetical protein